MSLIVNEEFVQRQEAEREREELEDERQDEQERQTRTDAAPRSCRWWKRLEDRRADRNEDGGRE